LVGGGAASASEAAARPIDRNGSFRQSWGDPNWGDPGDPNREIRTEPGDPNQVDDLVEIRTNREIREIRTRLTISSCAGG
jgi:hypothetical protein